MFSKLIGYNKALKITTKENVWAGIIYVNPLTAEVHLNNIVT
jgi:hypothetical protein